MYGVQNRKSHGTLKKTITISSNAETIQNKRLDIKNLVWINERISIQIFGTMFIQVKSIHKYSNQRLEVFGVSK